MHSGRVPTRHTILFRCQVPPITTPAHPYQATPAPRYADAQFVCPLSMRLLSEQRTAVSNSASIMLAKFDFLQTVFTRMNAGSVCDC